MTEQLPGALAPAPKREPLAWIPGFLSELATSGVIRRSVRAAGITLPTAYDTRERYPEFAAAWNEALVTARASGGKVRAACAAAPKAEPAESPPKTLARASSTHWRPAFFQALAETSSVSVSAARAGVALAAVYKLRREDAGFAETWQAALHEGYDNLEMELLGHLRDPQPQRRMDVASALRLLAAHRQTVERRRALAAEEDEQGLLESIDRFIDDMRERREANSAILAEAATAAETDDGPQ